MGIFTCNGGSEGQPAYHPALLLKIYTPRLRALYGYLNSIRSSRKLERELKRNIEINQSLNSNNGKEFAYHEQVSKALDTNFYFANPYHSCERGLNEHTNGLIRQYLPKKTDFTKVEDGKIRFIQDRLNNRPRKLLAYKTPTEVFYATIFKKQSV